MRGARRLWTALHSGIRGIRATPLVFLASVLTMAAGLSLLGVFLLVVANMRSIVDRFGTELRVVAFVADGAPADDLLASARALPGAARVDYVSPAQALERLRVDLGSEASILEGLEHNPLPGSIEVEVLSDHRDPESVKALAGALAELPNVEDVRYGADWVESYARVLSAIEWTGGFLGAFLLVVLGAIVAGTVRLAVHSRAEEIEIQRLVGAAGWYVRLPFCLEGALQGAVAAALAIGCLRLLYALGLPLAREPLQLILGRADPVFFGAAEVALLVAAGIGLGIGGALVSLLQLEESS